jgi:replicative DNA helicase
MSSEPESFADAAPASRRDPIARPVEFQGATLPHSEEAERYLLACCLLDGATVVRECLKARLRPASFYVSAHGIAFEKIIDLHRRGIATDVAVLAEELRTAKQLDAVGGYGFLTAISAQVPTTAQAAFWIEKVRALWLLREAIRNSRTAVEECFAWVGEGELAEFFARYAAKWAKAAEWARGRASETQRDLAAAATAAAADAIAGKVDKSRWLTTGLPIVDSKLLPFDANNEDWLVIVAGLRSQGKSSVVRMIARHNWAAGKRGAVFLLETGGRGWRMRAAAQVARVNMREQDRELPEKISRYQAALAEQESWADERAWIFDDVFAIDDIEQRAKALDREIREKEIARGVPADEARGLDFIVVDYLQLVGCRVQKGMNREQVVAEISRRLKMLAKALNVTAFVLAQLSRDASKESRPPRLSDLRESGSIEQDADRVIALYMPAEDPARGGSPRAA